MQEALRHEEEHVRTRSHDPLLPAASVILACMLGRSLLIVLLALSGCREVSTPSTDGEPTKRTKELEAKHDQALHSSEPPAANEPREPATGIEPNSALPDPSSEREIIRVRCKVASATCNYGRKCCNALSEFCGQDQRCHPRE